MEEKKLRNELLQENGKERQNGGRRASMRLAGSKPKHENIDNGLQSGELYIYSCILDIDTGS